MLRGFFGRLYDTDAPSGSSPTAQPQPQPPAAPPQPPTSQPAPTAPVPDLTEQAQRLMGRYGDALTTITHLMSENYQLREERRQLRERLPDGAQVLTGDDVQRWQQYQVLGAVDALRSASAELESLRREARIREIADVTGYKPAVLSKLAGDLEFIVKDDAQGERSVLVKHEGQEIAIDTYAAAHWADFLPALQAQSEQPQAAGPTYPKQPTGSKAPKAKASSSYVGRAYRKPTFGPKE